MNDEFSLWYVTLKGKYTVETSIQFKGSQEDFTISSICQNVGKYPMDYESKTKMMLALPDIKA